MNVCEQLGRAVAASAAPSDAVGRDRVRLHVFDALAAQLAGAAVAETRDVAAVADAAGARGLAADVLRGCVAARCSEIDDIHLASCITPGAVIVPTALAAAAHLPDVDDETFLAAIVAGYAVLVRFGTAVDGARILYRGIWPTYLCTSFGVVATIGRLLRCDADALADAFAIAATLAVGTSGRIASRTSRWLTQGCAAQSAALAALAAARGLHGDRSLLDGRWSELTGIGLDTGALLAGLDECLAFPDVGFKPFCTARQALASVLALRALIDEGVPVDPIADVLVAVPEAYRAMIDRPAFPAARQESLADVRYQLALAALRPEALFDVVRDPLADDAPLRAFMQRVRIEADPELDALYPQRWPGRVTVRLDDGSVHAREMREPFGDPGTAFGWDAAREKFVRAAPHVRGCEAIEADARRLGEGTLPALVAALAGG